jgi:pyruvate,orthophosphate dikinase
MTQYDPDRLVSWIQETDPSIDDRMTLGSKALGLKHLAAYGYRVPDGFILTTELFGALPALAHAPLYEATAANVRAALRRLEQRTQLRLGDPERLLTLSIRSGAAISMPGLMDTFVNVGLNDELTEALARRPELTWSAWDSYRRFLQGWAMSAGVSRDVFDELMLTFKDRYRVSQKLDFTAAQMRELAYAYKAQARELGVVFLDDPVDQVLACIRKVLDSWYAPPARFYRTYTGVAEEWGTAVIIQRMVLGNRGRTSGAGVTFTRSPQELESRRVRLYGDFAVGSQGEDLVGGLVYPLPISEAQRIASPTHNRQEHSLERDFPEVYARLLCVARDLVEQREYDSQEIEFTFESAAADDLYLLQKRPMIQNAGEEWPIFDMRGCDACELPLASGVGVSGGAYAGRVAIDAAQLAALRADDSDTPVVLLRPDTVPEDLSMIVQAQGILTARGGSTSHAAVTAKRLGKTAVVDCRALEVNEREGTARLAGRSLHPGDWVSIDGRTGHIYLGRLPTMKAPAGTF